MCVYACARLWLWRERPVLPYLIVWHIGGVTAKTLGLLRALCMLATRLSLRHAISGSVDVLIDRVGHLGANSALALV